MDSDACQDITLMQLRWRRAMYPLYSADQAYLSLFHTAITLPNPHTLYLYF